MLMEGDPFCLLEGMVAAHGVGADRGVIYLRSEYPDAIRVMNEAIEGQDPGLAGCWDTGFRPQL